MIFRRTVRFKREFNELPAKIQKSPAPNLLGSAPIGSIPLSADTSSKALPGTAIRSLIGNR